MASGTSNADPASKRAPKYLVLDRIAMTVEHPCIIKNVNKAYSMIGGPPAVARSIKAGPGPEASLNLHFHPDDLASRPVVSIPRTANNILLEVTVPKRTGRKRKRGSNSPFVEDLNDQPPARDAQYLLQSLQDNPDSYSLQPLATISSTHVWRSMPDFVYSTAQSDFLNELREKVLPKSYPLLKQYTLPQTYGLTNTEVIPPAQLSSTKIPTNYSYRSNPLIPLHTSPTTHHQTLYHSAIVKQNHPISVQWYSTFPTSPPTTLPPLSIQPLVTTLRTIFTTRPIWTRRALINQLPPSTSLSTLRSALTHVAFTIRSGPWRDTLCAFGIDPRSSSEHRTYQTISVQLGRKQGAELTPAAEGEDSDSNSPPGWTRSTHPTSHIFTGQGPIPPDGSTWQVCDITDPQLASIVSLDPTLIETTETCEKRVRGFYPAAAWAKLKIALRVKIEGMQKGKERGEDEVGIERLLALPDVWDGEGDVGLDLPGKADNHGGDAAEDLKNEGHWTVLWRAAVRGMISMEEKTAAEKGRSILVEDAAGEMVDGGSAGTSDIIDTGEVPDGDGNVFLEEEGKGEGEGEEESGNEGEEPQDATSEGLP